MSMMQNYVDNIKTKGKDKNILITRLQNLLAMKEQAKEELANIDDMIVNVIESLEELGIDIKDL